MQPYASREGKEKKREKKNDNVMLYPIESAVVNNNIETHETNSFVNLLGTLRRVYAVDVKKKMKKKKQKKKGRTIHVTFKPSLSVKRRSHLESFLAESVYIVNKVARVIIEKKLNEMRRFSYSLKSL